MSRNLILVLAAFCALIALGALVHDALNSAAGGRAGLQMLGVLIVGALCWLRWRFEWQNVFLLPALIVGAVMLLLFAILGVGGAIRFSGLSSDAGSPPSVLDLLLGVLGALMLLQLWKDRSRTGGAGRPEEQTDPDAKE